MSNGTMKSPSALRCPCLVCAWRCYLLSPPFLLMSHQMALALSTASMLTSSEVMPSGFISRNGDGLLLVDSISRTVRASSVAEQYSLRALMCGSHHSAVGQKTPLFPTNITTNNCIFILFLH